MTPQKNILLGYNFKALITRVTYCKSWPRIKSLWRYFFSFFMCPKQENFANIFFQKLLSITPWFYLPEYYFTGKFWNSRLNWSWIDLTTNTATSFSLRLRWTLSKSSFSRFKKIQSFFFRYYFSWKEHFQKTSRRIWK